MQLLRRLREAVISLTRSGIFFSPSGQTPEDELMRAILEFGRMKCAFYGTENTLVDSAEIAFRLRERDGSIRNALASLEQYGLAEHTDSPQLWKLKIASEHVVDAVLVLPAKSNLKANLKDRFYLGKQSSDLSMVSDNPAL